MNATALISFAIALIAIVSISWYKRQTPVNALGFFFANKQLGYLSVGCALYFTNVSATEFIGGSQTAYINNMSVMAWGVSSVLAMLIVSEYIIPIYLKGKMLTTPDFLEKRFDSTTKKIASLMFLVSYFANILPIILYGGAVAVNGLFHFTDHWPYGYFSMIALLVVCVGLLGLMYSTIGLKAIVVSDVLLAICLTLSGILFLYFAFSHLGNGSIVKGIRLVTSSHQEHLNAIGTKNDAVPFYTMFTGMFIINLFYWGTEQVMLQQALAGKSLIDIQKGIAMASFGKLLGPFLFILPGVLAVHAIPGIQNSVEAFPRMVSLVTPSVITGIIGTVMFGSIITSFSATLNSASTLFVLNFYQPAKERKTGVKMKGEHVIKTAKRFEVIVCVVAILVAPFIYFVKGSFYTYIQKVSACFSIPIFTIVLAGFATKWITSFAAKIGLIVCIAGYIITQFLLDTSIHFLHMIFILFLSTMAIMAVISKLYPSKTLAEPIRFSQSETALHYWKHRHIVSIVLLVLMLAVFVLFSRWGVAK
ncbi:solute:sodium symporter family transporter [Danxiaibacter flavus]|uniref:Solute:sodium symporter family transporter n=1 Tax=Danxiaibacter flavus TaxID=3049108 RepID=A0ABV3ZG04_9BACT|nr:solute:sodium symporter family transporter [Chitinophagaceae bacterium DXS]